ncbi:hypothetical protein CEXT_144361, partial [Caerostris extrusa]
LSHDCSNKNYLIDDSKKKSFEFVQLFPFLQNDTLPSKFRRYREECLSMRRRRSAQWKREEANIRNIFILSARFDSARPRIEKNPE